LSVIKTIEDQSVFGFTGKVNVLLKSNNQFAAAVYLSDGQIVNASYKQMTGKKALLKLIFDDVDAVSDFKYVVEPELIKDSQVNFNISLKQIKSEAEALYSKYKESLKLKPPGHLKLVIDGDFIIDGSTVNNHEFELMSILTEYSTVNDIYKYSKLYEYEVTEALVSLRKKKALKVFKS